MARALRAALDRGFGLVGVWAMERELSRIEAEAVISRLARQALAEAEALRALPCARSETDIAIAKAAHARTAAAWRGALRLNDLDALAPMVVGAAADLGLATPGAAATPALLREAARRLVAVAEENIAREDGVYAGDLALLQDSLAAGRTSTAPADRAAVTRAPTVAQPPTAREAMIVAAPMPDAAVVDPPRKTGAGSMMASVAPVPAAQLCDASGESAADVVALSAAGAEPARLASDGSGRAEKTRAAVATGLSARSKSTPLVRQAADSPSVEPKGAATARSSRASRPAAAKAKATAARRRCAKPKAGLYRRGVADAHVEKLRRLEGEALWDITIIDAFVLESHPGGPCRRAHHNGRSPPRSGDVSPIARCSVGSAGPKS